MSQPSAKASLPSLFAIIIVDLIGFGVVIPILPFYADSFGASATVLGLVFTCHAGAQFLFAPVWGRISDRWGRRPVMLVTIAGTSAALALLGAADSLFLLFVARLLGGVFGANISVATAYITDVTAEDERTKYMGLLGASFAVGFILGPAIGGGLAPFGYHVPMYFAAALAAINFVVAWGRLQEPKRAAQAPDRARRFRLPADPRVQRLCLAYFIFVFGISQLETIFALFMKDRFQWDARQVAFILVFLGVLMAGIQGGAIRPLSRRFGEKRLLMYGTLLVGPMLAMVPLMPTVWWMIVPLGLSSVGRGLVHPALLSLVSRAASPEDRGLVMGTFQSSASLARVVGPLAAGALYDIRLGLPFFLAGALMALVLVIAAALDR